MKIYFVRHGQSILNAQNIYQAKHIKLSSLGIEQTKLLANRLKNVEIDKIIASPYERTKQTAEIIAEKLDKPVVFSEVFKELKRPTEIEGKHVDDPYAKEVKAQIFQNLHNSDYHYSDEETYYDFRSRAIKALEYLEHLNRKNVLVVTHGVIIRMLVAIMFLGKEIKADDFKSFRSVLKTNNTGVTICDYIDSKWRLISWNNFSHLE